MARSASFLEPTRCDGGAGSSSERQSLERPQPAGGPEAADSQGVATGSHDFAKYHGKRHSLRRPGAQTATCRTVCRAKARPGERVMPTRRIRAVALRGWQTEFGSGPAAVRQDGFATRPEAAAWGDGMVQAARISTFRIGRRQVLATGAEALRRWSIEQGTLPAAEGGTHVAPLARLAALAEDPACLLPMAALTPAELARLRLRRQAALGSAAAVLAEQAALAAAFSALCELYLQECGNPLGLTAPDGCYLLPMATRDAIVARATQEDPQLGLALELLFATAARPEELAACRRGDLDMARRCLLLPGRAVGLPNSLAGRLPAANPPDAPLLAGPWPGQVPAWLAALPRMLPRCSLELPLTAETLRFTALVARLQAGCHLDEALILAGAAPAAALELPIPWS